MAALSDEQLRALRFLAQRSRGCSEATLLEQGFSVGQLGHLISSGLAKLRGTSHPESVPGEDHRGGAEGDRGVISADRD
jgi:hypothetical protein